MARVFVSYSRVDRSVADQLTQHLRRVYGYQNIWLDEVLHGGQLWWEEILHQIAECDIFIYLLTRDSIESAYCRAEYKEALRLQKLILPVVIRARTVAPQDMLRYQFVDMSAGLTVDSMTDLQAAITQLSAQIPPSPLPPRAPTPTDVPAMTGAIEIGGPSASQQAQRRAMLLGVLGAAAILVIGSGNIDAHPHGRALDRCGCRQHRGRSDGNAYSAIDRDAG